MHCLAQKLPDDIIKHLTSAKEDFGAYISYNKVCPGKQNDDYIAVEEFLEGTFEKCINNNDDL